MKVEHIRTQMKENPYGPTALLLSALDETACKYFCSFVHETVQTCWMVNISVYAVEEKKKHYKNNRPNVQTCLKSNLSCLLSVPFSFVGHLVAAGL